MTALRSRLTGVVTHPWFVIALAAFLAFAVMSSTTGTVQILTFILINVIFAQSINVLTGLGGQISLGHAGFFGIGAYGTAVLTKTYNLDMAVSIPTASVLAGAAGYLLSFPAGRVREVYLAMMTLGFGMIFYEVVREWVSVTGGTMGLSGVPSAALRSASILGAPLDQVGYFWVVLAVTLAVVALLSNMTRSHVGRALFAVHHNEVAAGSLGISHAATKRTAYALSGLLAGLAGAFYAHLVGYLGPESFGVHRSIEVLVIAIVGGLGSIAGQIISAAVFTYLPEALQAFAEYQFIVYGVILTFSLIVLPKGIAGLILDPPRFVRPAALAAARERKPELVWNDSVGRVAVTVEGLTKRFGGLTALDDVSLTLKPGNITALIGPNGSGKSTLVNVVCGIYEPTEGRVRLGETDISGLPDYKIAGMGVVRTFQDPRLVPSFTVRENLLLGAHCLVERSGVAAALALPSAMREEAAFLSEIEAVMALTGLSEYADTTVNSLPYGYCRMAEVARALMARPHTILLDEPAAGLSESEMEMLGAIIRKMKQAGLTIMLIEHHMDFLADLVDDVVVLDSGHVIYRGDLEGMRKDPAVIAAYLGQEEEEAA
ncbi:MAG: branched-chain amino acid ABC transporter ATP-binding protein/permease [Microvirga sp.]|nr:branched-chain amino acid ABC transporter ATP-binding protein/permease [Microvirga sp.]